MNKQQLWECAKEAAQKAYAPYSGFQVGAALLCEDGTVYTGCNIENASYSATVCAERTALFTAVAAGQRNFTAIAVAGGAKGRCISECPPCGVCRQALREFCGDGFLIVLGQQGGTLHKYTLKDLLPRSFSL